jgi:acetyl-CoA carboxylase carboxyl transferase subunit alpha
VKEPLGGAHKDREQTFRSVSNTIVKSYNEFKNLSPKELVDQRMEKYAQMGVFKD